RARPRRALAASRGHDPAALGVCAPTEQRSRDRGQMSGDELCDWRLSERAWRLAASFTLQARRD
ncbi:MAG: hypothetical protein ACYCO3_09355, partial [Mycobacteriales bacterium]